VLPGLVDTHVHLAFDASSDPAGALAQRDEHAALAAMRQAARTALLRGVTTVRDLGDRDYLALRLRGDPDLPTIAASGPPLTTPQGHCHFLGGATAPDPRAVRAAVREHADHGVDVIKIMASGGDLTAGSTPHLTQFDRDCLHAAVDEAHRHGLPITAHAHAKASVADAVAAGMDSIEHASFWSADGIEDPGQLLDIIAARGIVISATMGFGPTPAAAVPPRIAALLPAIAELRRRMYAAGTTLVVGTDAGISPSKPHGVLGYCLDQLTETGMPSLGALRAITSVAARTCGLGDRKGRITPGYDADLLAIDADPTIDPTALHRVLAVYAHGQWMRAPHPGTPSHPGTRRHHRPAAHDDRILMGWSRCRSPQQPEGGTMLPAIPPFAVQSGEGKVLPTPTGDSVTIKADSRTTNGSLTVAEFVISPHQGPALHTHLSEDEVWYVLEGDFRFKAGDAMFRASPGGLAFGPRGTPHCFQNITDMPGRLLVITTPSGMEHFFEEFAQLLPTPVDPDTVAALAQAHGYEFVGPPLQISDPLPTR